MPMIQVTYPAGTLDRSSPLGNRHAPTDSAYHVAGSEQAYAGMACQRNLQGRKHEPYFIDVADICVGDNTGNQKSVAGLLSATGETGTA